MADKATLKTRLLRLANVQASEAGLSAEIDTLMDDSLTEHNRNFNFAALPANEVEPFLILCQIRICLFRANTFSTQASTSGHQNWNQNNDTPYKKCLDLAKSLRLRYVELMGFIKDDLGGSGAAPSDIQVSQVSVENEEIDALVPYNQSPTPPAPILSLAVGESLSVGTTFLLNWNFPKNWSNFGSFQLFMLTTAANGTDTIRQPWNTVQAIKLPEINDSATQLTRLNSSTYAAIKVTDVDKTKRNCFLLVAVSRSLQYGYSNELVLVAP